MLGNLATYDQVVTSLIAADTIVASHFVTKQGVDLAAMVPGTLGSHGTASWTSDGASTSAGNSGYVCISSLINLNPTQTHDLTLTETVNTTLTQNHTELYYRINGGAWTLLETTPVHATSGSVVYDYTHTFNATGTIEFALVTYWSAYKTASVKLKWVSQSWA